mgnify:CR=1 FL=1
MDAGGWLLLGTDTQDVFGEVGERALHPALQPGGGELAGIQTGNGDTSEVAVEPGQLRAETGGDAVDPPAKGGIGPGEGMALIHI